MYSFKKLLLALLSGIVLGIALQAIVQVVKTQEALDHSNDLIDYLIGQWTATSVDDTVSISNNDIAQVAARKELPMARLGYFPDTVRVLATMVESRYNVPSAVTLAQWALESQWGKRNLGASNYFGHTFAATKKFMFRPRYVLRHELVNVLGVNTPGSAVKFACYSSIEECFDVHGQYLSQTHLYRDAFLAMNAEQFARIIANHYATDPDYSLKLITIMRRYKL
jgi:flagellum-specific peptidoglycan hydrolase FlgJ